LTSRKIHVDRGASADKSGNAAAGSTFTITNTATNIGGQVIGGAAGDSTIKESLPVGIAAITNQPSFGIGANMMNTAGGAGWLPNPNESAINDKTIRGALKDYMSTLDVVGFPDKGVVIIGYISADKNVSIDSINPISSTLPIDFVVSDSSITTTSAPDTTTGAVLAGGGRRRRTRRHSKKRARKTFVKSQR